MANVTSYQLLQDGPRNVVVKFEGILDTSDIAAAGTLGTAATGATTSGSTTITFTAGGLAPVVGQYVTGTGIPAGAYIVSFTTTSAVISAAATATGAGLTFSLVAGNIVLVDPAVLSPIDNVTGELASTLRIDDLKFEIEDLLAVNLLWDAATPVRIGQYVGRNTEKYFKISPLQNNATSPTGRILVNTQGWTAGATLSFTMYIRMVKQ